MNELWFAYVILFAWIVWRVEWRIARTGDANFDAIDRACHNMTRRLTALEERAGYTTEDYAEVSKDFRLPKGMEFEPRVVIREEGQVDDIVAL